MNVCHACGKEQTLGRVIGRKDECPHCHADLRCCVNCRFFVRSAPKQCSEPIAELVREKDKANYCDLFGYSDAGTAGPSIPAAETARKALDKLFKK